MKLISRDRKQNPELKTSASEDDPGASTDARDSPGVARIRAEAMEKYEAAIEIYRCGGCRLREIERGSIERLQASDRPRPMWAVPPSSDRRHDSEVWPRSAHRLSIAGVFCSDGEYWRIGFRGRESFIKDRKGLHYIADLLRCPGNEIHALDLAAVGVVSVEPTIRRESGRSTAIKWRPINDYLRSAATADPLLHHRAKAEYLIRLAELRAELAAAEANGDEQRTGSIEVEMDSLRLELRRAFGLRRRPQLALSAAERARINVTRSLRLAVGRIAEVSPDLGGHLNESITTGLLCCYRPDATRPIDWRL